ncbi:hypothetical protein VNO77_39497 [Canavalia gladiata]|uniref:Uncharacterized protein n=1 Tax=Canavalia gladiata TaxID=3824 RepID=A0AAN9PZU4_CANGL
MIGGISLCWSNSMTFSKSIQDSKSILHITLYASKDVVQSDGKNVIPKIWEVMDKIEEIFKQVCNGSWEGAIGKALKDFVAISISGSFLDLVGSR